MIWWNDPNPGLAFTTQLVLKRPILQGGAQFGYSLAIGDVDGDNDTCKELVIGAPYADTDLQQDAGEVWVWPWCAGTDSGGGIPGMLGFQRILNPNPDPNEEFGFRVAVFDISDEGPTTPDPQPCSEVVIGVPGEVAPNGSGNHDGGVFVYPFCDRGSYWLREPTPESGSEVGWSVAAGYTYEDLDADDTAPWAPMIVVGAPDGTNATSGLQILGNMAGTSIRAQDALVGAPTASFSSCTFYSGYQAGRATAHESFQ